MNVLAVICARGGSKGIPQKNIRKINGKPLISWTIEQALRIKEFSNIVISSDSNQIYPTCQNLLWLLLDLFDLDLVTGFPV